jgi:hypothetical protein
MRPIPHLLGTLACLVLLYLAYPVGAYHHDERSFYAATTASSYILYSSLALALTQIGRTKKAKAWAFFIGGLVVIGLYMPAIRYVVDLFYVEDGHWRDASFQVFRELYFWSPIIVGSLCIYRAVSMWADESLDQRRSSPLLPPTAGTVSSTDSVEFPTG